MKKLIIFLMFFILCSISNGQEWAFNTKSIEVGVTINSGLDIIPEESDYQVDEIKTELFLFPKENEYQKILSLNVDPEALVVNNSLLFSWNNLEEKRFTFNLDSKIRIEESRKNVKNKVDFPLKEVPEELLSYVLPQKNIDSDNEDIIRIASSIAEGENDMFVVVFTIAEWVEENVKYSLNTLTEKFSQKASWVLKNRYGVCDELTSLFIAMVRSLGIPARYVSGYAYTSWNELNNFGSHAWAEVFFPGYGWVAFDLTYREFGFVDVGHVTLMQSLDAAESSIKFQVVGRDIKIETDELNIDVNLKKKIGLQKPKLSMGVSLAKREVDFGSHNLVTAEIENLEDYYVATVFSIANTTKLNFFDKLHRGVLLKPKEKRKLYWVVKVEEDLQEGYYYVLPIQIYTREGVKSEINFTSKEDAIDLSFADVEIMVNEATEEDAKVYSKKIELNCDSDAFAYVNESMNINCIIKNKGNVYLEEIKVCVDECVSFNLGISQKKELKFTAMAKDGLKVKVQSKDISKVVYIETEILDFPKLEIINLVFPEKVKYEDNFSVSFSVRKTSKSNPLSIDIKLSGLVGNFKLNELIQQQDLSLKFKGNDLQTGNNSLILEMAYKDKRMREYSEKKGFVIELEKVNFWQRIVLTLKGLNKFIDNLIS